MTPAQLRTLAALASAGSVTTAAERLFVSQPAVSAAVSALQRELGVALVEREGRGLRLTPAGETLAAYAHRILGLLDEAATATASAADAETGTVRLAAVTTAGERILPRSIAGFRARHARASVRLEVANRDRVFEMLVGHDVDLGLAGRPPRGAFRSLGTRPNELVLVAAPGAVSSSAPAALARHTWLLREHGSGTRATVAEYHAALGIDPPTLTLGSNGAIREALIVGLGVGLLSMDAVAGDIAARRLVPVRARGMPLRRDWHLVARSEGMLSATARLFVDHVLGTGDFVGPPADHGARR